MRTLRDIMTPDPITLDANMTLREGVEHLRERGVTGAPVVTGTRIVGVVSGTDVLELAAASPGVPRERPDRLDVDETDIEDDDVDAAPGAYFVDRWFDTESDVWTRVTESDAPEWDVMDEHRISEIMTRRLVALPPDASVAEAARRMVDEGVHRVLVIDGDDLVGVVSTMDIVRGVAESAEQEAEVDAMRSGPEKYR